MTVSPHRPKLLDLFCGAGGAARGYQRAGFYVVGVDIKPQPRYGGDEFIEADAMTYPLEGFDAIHASPPCQGYTLMQNFGSPPQPRLIVPVREMLSRYALPWVIENVEGARSEMRDPVLICGASFGLGAAGMDLSRHRLFESNVTLWTMQCQHRRGQTIGVYGHGTNAWHRKKIGRNITMAERREAMGIDWMRRGEDSEAIPPAYTEFIGAQLLRAVEQAA